MSNEELNKKMEFIIEHQAKFAADLEIMREVQAADTRRLSDALLSTLTIVGNLMEAQAGLMEAQKRTEENVKGLAESLKSLTESQKRTDERLNIFINVVERYISGNGGSERHA